MHSLDQQLAVLNIDPAVLQVDAAGTQALDLGAFQLDARFQRFEHEILVTRLAVCGDGLCRRTFLGRCHEARLLSFTPEAVFISIAHRPNGLFARILRCFPLQSTKDRCGKPPCIRAKILVVRRTLLIKAASLSCHYITFCWIFKSDF